MHTPATAMLWELWRLTGRRVVTQVTLSIVVGASTLTVAGFYGASDQVATMVLLILCVSSALSSARAKFPLYLGFQRPVPTWLLAGVPMLYLGCASAASYLAPAVLLRTLFDIPFPLAPAAASVAACALVFGFCNWWTHHKTAQVVSGYLFIAGVILIYRTMHPVNLAGNDFPPERWAAMFSFSPRDYALLALAGAAAVGLTIVGVARQRHGDDGFGWPGPGASGRSGALLDRLEDGVRVPCPTSSPGRAQVWIEMKRSGANVLWMGVIVALSIPVMFLLWNTYQWELALLAAVVSPVFPVLVGVSSMLAFRRRQGVTDLGVFDATCPLGTARLVGLKVLLTVLCILGAWLVIGASFWVSLALEPWGGGARDSIAGYLAAVPVGRLAVLVLWGGLLLGAVVGYAAVLQTFFVLHARRATLWLLGISGYGLLFGLVFAGGWVDMSVVTLHAWVAAGLIPVGTIYAFRQALADSVLTAAQARGAVLVWLGVAAAGLVLLRDSPPQFQTPVPALLALGAAVSLMPLAAVALAPWSFSLMRHR